MKKFAFVLTGLSFALLSSTGVVLAADEQIQKMAQITMSLNHYPSDDDKAALKEIIDSDESSEEEADIAMAITNIEHNVVEKDTERLSDIVSDEESEEDARKLASILLRLKHTASDEDKVELAALAKE